MKKKAKKAKRAKTVIDALKAYKAERRKEEIELHGKPISQSSVTTNKKKYTRKKKHKDQLLEE